MDAVEHLPLLDDALRLALAQLGDRAAAGAVNARQAKHLHRLAGLSAQPEPRRFRGEPLARAAALRLGRRGLVDPGPLLVAVDPDGREIADPADRAFRDGLPVAAEHGVAVRTGRGRDQQDVGGREVVGDAGIVRLRPEGAHREARAARERLGLLPFGDGRRDAREARALPLGEVPGREAEAEDEEIHALCHPDAALPAAHKVPFAHA